MPKRSIKVRIDERELVLKGRLGWTAERLIQSGAIGITAYDPDHPAPRLASYIHRLKHRHGIQIASRDEKHGGIYAGTHARYYLIGRGEVVERSIGST